MSDGDPTQAVPGTASKSAGNPQPSLLGASRYTRFVRRMRILLPIAAIALGALVLAYAGLFDFEQQGPGFVVSDELGTDLRMISPRLTGTDEEGRPYLVTARAATQVDADSSLIDMDGIQADLLVEDGQGWISLKAQRGKMNTDDKQLALAGKIDIYSDSGYEFHTTKADIDLADGSMVAPVPVTAHGPAGSISADRMTAKDRGQVVTFTGNARVVVFGETTSDSATEMNK